MINFVYASKIIYLELNLCDFRMLIVCAFRYITLNVRTRVWTGAYQM